MEGWGSFGLVGVPGAVYVSACASTHVPKLYQANCVYLQASALVSVYICTLGQFVIVVSRLQ